MKTKTILALSVSGVVLTGLLIGPALVDWNKYKPEIIKVAKEKAGYTVHIDGDIGVSALPTPRLKIRGLSVDAPAGREPKLITVDEAYVSVDLLPLLTGNIVVDTVRLDKPRIAIEKLMDGSFSWVVDNVVGNETQAAQTNNNSSGSGRSVTLGKVIINDGDLSYRDAQTGATQSVSDVNITASADTLEGPFKAKGDLVYQAKKIEFNVDTDRPKGDRKEFEAKLDLGLPDADADLSFKGVVALSPMQVQGKMTLSADNLAAVMSASGEESGSSPLAQPLKFSGLVTAGETEVRSEDIDVEFGGTKGQGNFILSNLKDRNPVQLNANIGFSNELDLDAIAKKIDKSKGPSVEERVAKGESLSAQQGFLPQSLSLPFPVDAKVGVQAQSIKSGGQTYKGLMLDIASSGAETNFVAKVDELAGRSNLSASGTLAYAKSAKSGDQGVTYSAPSLRYAVTGATQQLPTLLRAYVQDQDDNKALEIYKTASFDLKGSVAGDQFVLSDGSLKLDDTAVALAGSYRPRGQNGRPDIALDMSTDVVDADYIQSRMNGQNTQSVQKDTSEKADMKAALEPVRGIDIPVNLTLDLSVQKARFKGQDVNGIRIKGRAAGAALDIDVASAQDFMGAAASLKGRVDDLKTLSGVDLSFYGKTADLKTLMQSMDMDTSKLPSGLSAAEATLKAQGKAENLDFNANVNAMNGSLKASGVMTGLLDTPSFSNITLGVSHPNLVKAIQIVKPEFSGGTGLEKAFSFETKAIKNVNRYDLNDMKATLGTMTLTGALSVDQGAAKPTVSGTLKAGDIPLDSLLGAKAASAGNAATSSGGGAASSGGKWSKAPLETGWMQSMNVDLSLAANSITYGNWNFQQPSTKITLKDGTLNVDGLKSGVFGGQAKLNARVVDPADEKQPLSLSLQTNMDEVNMESLAAALSGSRRIKASGVANFDLDISGTGLSSYALVSSLKGKSTLNGANIVMKGFDLAQIGLAFVDTGKPMDRLNNIVGGATSSGETRFDTVKGVYDIAQGIATISAMEMDGTAANIKSKGAVNLPQWTIDTVHTITFKNAKDAGAFDVAIKGPLDRPLNTFGKGLFNDVLTRRLQGQATKKLQEKLPDVLGKDLTGKLQGLGILPAGQTQEQPAAPAQQDTAEPAAETPVEQAPQTPPTPATQPDPQKQLEEKAGEAIQGVLNGLLQ